MWISSKVFFKTAQFQEIRIFYQVFDVVGTADLKLHPKWKNLFLRRDLLYARAVDLITNVGRFLAGTQHSQHLLACLKRLSSQHFKSHTPLQQGSQIHSAQRWKYHKEELPFMGIQHLALSSIGMWNLKMSYMFLHRRPVNCWKNPTVYASSDLSGPSRRTTISALFSQNPSAPLAPLRWRRNVRLNSRRKIFLVQAECKPRP